MNKNEMTLQDYIKLAESATDGPWYCDEGTPGHIKSKSPNNRKISDDVGHATPSVARFDVWSSFEKLPDIPEFQEYKEKEKHNGAFIAASRTLGPQMAKALIEAEEALKAIVELQKILGKDPNVDLICIYAEKPLATIQALNGGEA
jgi:hypothetical protein